MKSKHVVTVAKSGAIYVPKLTTKYLGIFDWAGVVIVVEEKYIYMRFYKHSITPKEGELVVKLQKKSGGRQAMTGGCRKFSEAIKSDFGDANYLDLHIKTMFADEESVRISLGRPSRKDEESKETTGKDAQAEVAHWIRSNGCGDIDCEGRKGRFKGIECPVRGVTNCGRKIAGDWLSSNGYSLDQETSLGTVSNPITEKQLDIFNLPGSKVASTPRTRPLPEWLPEWLHGPLSRGRHVQVSVRMPDKKAIAGWAIGACSKFMPRFKKFEVAVIIGYGESSTVLLCSPGSIFQSPGSLVSPDKCYKIAGKLGIGLSALQIEAINSGGVPPEDHGLPDEMFE